MATTVTSPTWQEKAAAKQAAAFAKIPPEWLLDSEYLKSDQSSTFGVLDIPAKCGILDAVEVAITENYNAVSLARAVQSGSLKAVDVATAFCKRAAIAQQLTRCLTETMFTDAIERGKYLDQYLAEHKRPIGPLHGVPISLKDPFQYIGVQSTIGFISFLDHAPAKTNAPLVEILLELGAILYCKTNVPQTMMCAESTNNVFGRTLNPHKLMLGAGGSSGGEGALVALRGSVLGVGTDIGGSIRIPSICCGTYGYKPSTARVPYGGQAAPGRKGSPGFPAVAGPLANSFDDLHFFMKHVIEAQPWNKDASALPIPWRTSVAESAFPRVRIGCLVADPHYPVHPPVVRALAFATQKLTASGFDLVPLAAFPSLKIGVDLATDYYSLDNTKTFKKNIADGGEHMIPELAALEWSVNKKPHYSLEEVFDLNAAKIDYRAAWHQIWVDNKLDVILCPGAQTTAVPHGQYGFPAYTAVWNLLEYCGVIIPVGKADRAIDKDDLAVPDMSRPYQSEDVHGAPLTVQLIGRSYQDEELISTASMVDRCLKS